MTRRDVTVADWKRPARVAVLLAAGAVGIASKWAPFPRWLIALVAFSVPAVWIITSFEAIKPGESEAQRRRRMRNIAIALALVGMVLLFYVATMARLGGNVFSRPI